MSTQSSSVATSKTQSVVLTLSPDVSDIVQVLLELKKLAIHVQHLETRPSRTKGSSVHNSDGEQTVVNGEIDYYLEFVSPSQDATTTLLSELEKISSNVVILSPSANTEPWFPRHISELHRCCTTLFKYGHELAPDHPGYGDTEYEKRRRDIAEISKNYKYGEKIPYIEFTESEIKTWREVFRNQTTLYPTHACKEYNTHFPELFSACGYREDNIPQLEDVSRYLRAHTGWQLWPVIGWISARDFLNALAFRVFPTTQYIRHHSSPLYTPEPDICHELMGHTPLFCDPCFAQFSQDIGLASLGISDEWIQKLATLYWFTVEFGMVDEGGKPKAYGAGLLSGCQELQYCVTDTPKHCNLELEQAITTSYPETGLQPLYFVASSMEDMRTKLLEFSKSIPRSFTVSYDPYTQCVRVLNNEGEVKKLAKDIQQQVVLLNQSLTNVSFS